MPLSVSLPILVSRREQTKVGHGHLVRNLGLKDIRALITRTVNFVIVHKYNQLMKDFPLNELLSATDATKVRDSLVLIFGHLNKKLKLS